MERAKKELRTARVMKATDPPPHRGRQGTNRRHHPTHAAAGRAEAERKKREQEAEEAPTGRALIGYAATRRKKTPRPRSGHSSSWRNAITPTRAAIIMTSSESRTPMTGLAVWRPVAASGPSIFD